MTTTLNDVTNENLEKVSRQFAHLMSRSKATDSSSEAENCVVLAQRLLWKYNLEESQLLSLKEIGKRAKRTYIKDTVKVGKNTWMMNGNFNSRDWKQSLLATIAKSFFCKIRPGGYDSDTVVGEAQNVQMVKDMYAYLEKQIRAVRKVAYKDAEPNLPRALCNNGRRYSNKPQQFAVLAWKESFAKGTVAAIETRLELTQKENVEEADAARPSVQGEISYAAALVTQIYNDLDEAYYEYFPDEHPEKIKLREYQALLEYRARMEVLEQQRVEREARIEAGLEEPPAPPKPQKEFKRRGRKRQWRSTDNYSAYNQGKVAGNNMQLHVAVNSGTKSLK